MRGEQSRSLPRHKHSGTHAQSQTRNIDPTDDLFEGFAGDAASHQLLEC